ncbi:MAG: hypothetical protein IT463_02930 [Planctomycetes bacterium]|nr:hypothetical protein [Planctomycetota bacterium]
MKKVFFWTTALALALIGVSRPAVADDEDDAAKKRREIFGKSFEEKVEEAVDKGCDGLKKLQGIDKDEDKAIYGQFPPNPPLYGAGEPHRYRIARTAFPIQALCKSGVFADDPAVAKAMDWLRKNYKENGVLNNEQGFVPSTTYEDATVLNAVEAFYISAAEAKERGLDNPKKRVQEVDGKKVPIKRWGTEEKGAKKAKEEEKHKKRALVLSAEDKKICELAIKGLAKRFRKNVYGAAGWRYAFPGVGETQPQVDISATQYAMLGLKAASRLGLTYDKSMVMDCYHLFRSWQDADGPVVERKAKDAEGKDVEAPEDPKPKKDPNKSTRAWAPGAKDKARGWAYCRKDPHNPADVNTYGSMTAAGICALILIRDELETDGKMMARWKAVADQCQQALNDGLAWMVMNWSMSENPKRERYRYYYYLYTVERLGMLGGLDYIGSHDWYFEGAEILIKEQQEGTGLWDTQNEIDPSDLYDTCYALLFLKRATIGVDRPRPVFTGDDE